MSDATIPPVAPPSPFRYPIFRDIWLANLASRFGGLIQSVGASWIMVSLAPSPLLVSLVQVSTTLPILLLALLAGALADTFDRRWLMIVAQTFMLAVSTVLAVVAFTGGLTPWLLLLFTFLIGCGAAMNGPAWQASVGEMVPRASLPAAVALNSMGFNVARSIGPAIGGVIVAVAGAAAAFAVNAVSYLGLLVVLARWKPPVTARTLPREPLAAAITSGVRYVMLSPAIAVVLMRSAVFGAGASAVPAPMPLVASGLLRGGPLTYGILLGAFGVGAVLGALAATRIRTRMSSEAMVRLALAALAAGGIGMVATPIVAVAAAALLVAGAGWVLALSTFNVTVQMAAPRWVVGRALAIYQMAAFGGMAGGSWLWGAVTEAQGLQAALVGAALVLAACFAIGLRWPLADVSTHNLDPLDRWREPDLAIDVGPRSGPITVTVEYRIAVESQAAFADAMSRWRLVRRRDGARDWSLLRDLLDPELWIERYRTATWTEYVRHNTRRTHADAETSAAVRALHIGPDRPVVRRLIERPVGADHRDTVVEPQTDVSPQS